MHTQDNSIGSKSIITFTLFVLLSTIFLGFIVSSLLVVIFLDNSPLTGFISQLLLNLALMTWVVIIVSGAIIFFSRRQGTSVVSSVATSSFVPPKFSIIV